MQATLTAMQLYLFEPLEDHMNNIHQLPKRMRDMGIIFINTNCGSTVYFIDLILPSSKKKFREYLKKNNNGEENKSLDRLWRNLVEI